MDIINNNFKVFTYCRVGRKEQLNNVENQETWFNKVKELAEELGYASNMKEYKKNPESYKGNVADIATVLRVALTSKSNTPDLYEIMKLFTKNRVEKRYNNLINKFNDR